MKTIFLSIFLSAIALSSFSKDKGKGIFYIDSKSKGNIELMIFEKANNRSKSLATIVYSDFGDGQINYYVRGEKIKENNLVEFDYERLGLPICDVDKNWVEVIYGFDLDGKSLTGWVADQNEQTGYFFWRTYLQSKVLFFESVGDIVFFDEPNGNQLKFELAPSEYMHFDYTMKSLEVNGNWMRVEVTTPSDYCNNPEDKRTEVFWIKFLNKEERPLIWYFTRGC